jgi:hypothetical protein
VAACHYAITLARLFGRSGALPGPRPIGYVGRAGSGRRGTRREITPLIVIERDGRTVVITGWRAFIIAAVAVFVTAAVLAALAFLVLGVAVSMIAFQLIVMPVVAIVALMSWFFQPRRP